MAIDWTNPSDDAIEARRIGIDTALKVCREDGEEMDAEVKRLREFRSEICDALGDCVSCLPAGETWASTNDGVVQYVRDVVNEVARLQTNMDKLPKWADDLMDIYNELHGVRGAGMAKRSIIAMRKSIQRVAEVGEDE